MVQLKIKVTREILERSRMCDATNHKSAYNQNCAIALAVRDIMPDARVGSVGIFPNEESELRCCFGEDDPCMIPLPMNARDFIKKFDYLGKMKLYEERTLIHQIEFTVEIPDSIINGINIEEIRPLLQNHPTLELV